MQSSLTVDQIRSVLKEVVDETTELSDYEKGVLKGQIDRMEESVLQDSANKILNSKPSQNTSEQSQAAQAEGVSENMKAAIYIQKIVKNLIAQGIPDEAQYEVIKNFLDNQKEIIN